VKREATSYCGNSRPLPSSFTSFEIFCREISRKVSEIVRKISQKFSQSPRNTFILKQLVTGESENKDSKVRSILRFLPHRWSSFHDCLERIIDQSGTLRLFFSNYGTKEEESYLSHHNLLMLKLLWCLVKKINDYILKFQSERLSILSVVHELKDCMIIFAKYVFEVNSLKFRDREELFDYIKELLITQKKGGDCKELKRNFESFKKYFLSRHTEFTELINQQNSDEFFGSAWEYLQTVVTEISDRFPLDESSILMADAFFLRDLRSISRIQQIGKRFGNVIDPNTELTKFNMEIEKLECNYNEIQSVIRMSEVKNWLKVWYINRQFYPLIYRIARALETLPYSTVSLERCFSQGTDIKTIKRNNISVGNLEACLLVKQHSEEELVSLTEQIVSKALNPTSSLLHLMTVDKNSNEMGQSQQVIHQAESPFSDPASNKIEENLQKQNELSQLNENDTSLATRFLELFRISAEHILKQENDLNTQSTLKRNSLALFDHPHQRIFKGNSGN